MNLEQSEGLIMNNPNRMKTKITVVFAALLTSLLSASAQAQPATFRYVPGPGEASWITNRTDKNLSISLAQIEIRVGAEWRAYPQPKASALGLLYFSPAGLNRNWLTPHEAGYGKLVAQGLTLPTNSVWRAKFKVSEQLAGGEDTDAAQKMSKAQKENPKVQLPSAADPETKFYGHTQIVYSDEIQP
jgi:hypothetical protein